MPNVIVNSCYIKSSQHFINYLEYAGKKLEAQTLVLSDGSRIELDSDELIDVSEAPDFKYIQLELKDGTIRRLSAERYQEYVLKQSEEYNEVEINTDINFSENDKLHSRNPSIYLDYIFYRPSVEKNPSSNHGLFGVTGAVDIDKAKATVLENENSIKWSHIISLTREGAESTGYDNRQAWENLIKAKAYDIGRLYNIPPEHLKIYGAYHDKAHHPHCHLFFYSDTNSTREGYAGFSEGDLQRKSENLRSIFNNEIFKNDVSYLKEEKQQIRKDIASEMKRIVQDIGKADYKPNQEIITAFTELSNSLSDYTGRAYYMYLSVENKQKVNDFLRLCIASDDKLQSIYNTLISNQRNFISMYNDDEEKISIRLNDFENHFFEPNSKNDMRTLHNIIIEQAMLANQQLVSQSLENVVRKEELFSFSNDNQSSAFLSETTNELVEEIIYQDDGLFKESSSNWWTKEYKTARFFLYGDKNTKPQLEKAYQSMLREANAGNTLALNDLAKMTLFGIGCEKNEAIVHKMFEKVLANLKTIETLEKNAYIEYRIGKMYEFGYGTDVDAKVAVEWYKKSFENNNGIFTHNPFAGNSLGNLYFQGNGVEQDYEKAFFYFQSSANHSAKPNAYSMYKLGTMYSSGVGTKQNMEKADMWFVRAYKGFQEIERNNNDDNILYKLGNMNYQGIGTKKNLTIAEEYFLKAIEFENSNAYYGLGRLYSDKEFNKYDIEKAIDYYQLAIEKQGSRNDIGQFAHYALGKLYLESETVPKDITKALENFEKSAKQGNQFAQYTLGKLYLEGEAIPKDINKALENFEKSANQGNQYAQYALGKLYFEDENGLKNVLKALRYFYASAGQGNQYAQYSLGKIYFEGKDVPKDIDKARAYFQASAQQGNVFAQRKLEYISGHQSTFIYATSLLLPKIAYAMASAVVQNSMNKKEKEENQKKDKQSPKFSSKNHHITKSNLTSYSPIQY